ncbi:MAG: PAS domain-containing protein [Thermoanaerobaculum sp.]|nr:PAS domain-containing protein [Thermoanaerobaculum sp.]
MNWLGGRVKALLRHWWAPRQAGGLWLLRDPFWSQALEVSGVGLWFHDLLTDTVIRTPQWARMLGYEPEEIPSTAAAWRALIHPEDLPAVDRAARLHEEGETPAFEVEHRLQCKSGEFKWVLNWGRVVERDPSGRALRALGAHVDIHRRKVAELEREHLLAELTRAQREVRQLKGIIPICAACKRVRADANSWQALEAYVRQHSEAEFSHGLCPECMATYFPGSFEKPEPGR